MARRGARPALRLFAILGALTVALVGVTARLVQLQVVKASTYEDLGSRQRIRRVELPALRGSILDRDGKPLAMSVEARAVYANPQLVTDPAATAKAIAPLLGLEPAVVQERLRRKVSFVYVARKLDVAVADRIMALRLPGLGTQDEMKRVYPAGPLASQVVGVVGTDNVGLSGLEAGWDRTLRGVAGEEILEQDPHGRPIPNGISKVRAPVPGQDLVLTIDRDIQFAAEQALATSVPQTGSKSGSAIVLDPKTGDVLAMANWPALDPTSFSSASGDLMRNRVVQDAYEPGSVNKVITAAAALEGNIAQPSTMLRIPNSLRVADKTFHDFESHGVWRLTYAEALARSSNIGTIEVALRVGKARLYGMLRRFGLGEKTGIGFPGESSGLLLNLKDWYQTSIGTIPIGQGIAVTPLQIARVYGTIANDGIGMRPRLVDSVVDRGGHTVSRTPPDARRVVSPATASQIRAMLLGVVEEGTGRKAQIPGYLIAGKTGTAQIPKPDGRGYTHDVVTTFVGMVPADAPRFVAAVVLDAPDIHMSAVTAAPAFKQIVQFVIGRLNVAPSFAIPASRPARLSSFRAVRP